MSEVRKQAFNECLQIIRANGQEIWTTISCLRTLIYLPLFLLTLKKSYHSLISNNILLLVGWAVECVFVTSLNLIIVLTDY